MGVRTWANHWVLQEVKLWIGRTTRCLGWVFYPGCKSQVLDEGTILVYLGEFQGFNPINPRNAHVPHVYFQYEGKIIFRYETLDAMVSKLAWIEIL